MIATNHRASTPQRILCRMGSKIDGYGTWQTSHRRFHSRPWISEVHENLFGKNALTEVSQTHLSLRFPSRHWKKARHRMCPIIGISKFRRKTLVIDCWRNSVGNKGKAWGKIPRASSIRSISKCEVDKIDPALILSFRGATPVNHSGLGQDRPSELDRNDDEFQMYRKRMMLAYRFRPNPLVRPPLTVTARDPLTFLLEQSTSRLLLTSVSLFLFIVAFVYNWSNFSLSHFLHIYVK